MDHVKRHTDITKTANLELDKDVDSGMMSGLTDDDKLQDVIIMGDIFDQLFQSKIRMVDAGLCNET